VLLQNQIISVHKVYFLFFHKNNQKTLFINHLKILLNHQQPNRMLILFGFGLADYLVSLGECIADELA
jgi:hypothetical protein